MPARVVARGVVDEAMRAARWDSMLLACLLLLKVVGEMDGGLGSMRTEQAVATQMQTWEHRLLRGFRFDAASACDIISC